MGFLARLHLRTMGQVMSLTASFSRTILEKKCAHTRDERMLHVHRPTVQSCVPSSTMDVL